MKLDTVIQNIVNNEIHVNASQMVNELSHGLTLNNASFFELYPELLGGPDYSECPDGYTVALESDGDFWCWYNDDNDAETTFETERDAIIDCWEYASAEPPFQEVMEYWIVGEMLARDLEDIGAVISRDVFGWNIWGRTETGQSLTMDSDIRRVAQALIERTAHV